MATYNFPLNVEGINQLIHLWIGLHKISNIQLVLTRKTDISYVFIHMSIRGNTPYSSHQVFTSLGVNTDIPVYHFD